MAKVLAILTLFISVAAFAETPQEGASEIFELLKKEDYESIFKTRYAERYKIEKEDMSAEEAIQKLSKPWKRNYVLYLEVYEQLSKAEFKLSKTDNPQVSQTGEVAVTDVLIQGNKVQFKLYKMKSGYWGFQL